MIKITYEEQSKPSKRMKAGELMALAKSAGQQAFYGTAGKNAEGVYLVSCDRIIALGDPGDCWGDQATVVFERWVDLEVIVK